MTYEKYIMKYIIQKLFEIFDSLWNDYFGTWSLTQSVLKSKFTLLFICHFKKIIKFVNISFWVGQSWPKLSFCEKNMVLRNANI